MRLSLKLWFTDVVFHALIVTTRITWVTNLVWSFNFKPSYALEWQRNLTATTPINTAIPTNTSAKVVTLEAWKAKINNHTITEASIVNTPWIALGMVAIHEKPTRGAVTNNGEPKHANTAKMEEKTKTMLIVETHKAININTNTSKKICDDIAH